MTLPFDHTHDLDLGVSRSESEIALSHREWGGGLTMNEKDVSHPFMTMIVSDGRGKDYESVLVAQFIHAYASEEYGETTETNKTNKHKQLGSKWLIQNTKKINIVIYTLSMSNNQTPLWLPMA